MERKVAFLMAWLMFGMLYAQPTIVIRKKSKGVNEDSIQAVLTKKCLLLFKQNTKYGLADEFGTISYPKYESVDTFDNSHRARVQMGGKYGYLNLKGELIIPATYNQATPFYQHEAWVQKNTSFPCFLTDGRGSFLREVKLKEVDSIGVFSEGFCWFKLNRKYGFLDTSGNVIVGNKFLQVQPYSNNLAAVKNSAWGFVNTNGKIVIPQQYTETTSFFQQRAGVFNGVSWGFINPQGKLLVKYTYDSVGTFSMGVCPVKRKGVWGLIDTNGKVIVKPKFERLLTAKEGLIPALYKGLWGFIDNKGNWALQPTFPYLESFSEGVAIAKKEGWVLIQREDLSLWRLSKGITQILPRKNGSLPIKIDNKWGFMGGQGDIIIRPKYDTVHYFSEDIAAVKLQKTWGFINLLENVMIPFRECVTVSDYAQGRNIVMLGYKQDNLPLWGSIDTVGKFKVVPSYNELVLTKEGVCGKKEGFWYQRIADKWFRVGKKPEVYVNSFEKITKSIQRSDNGLKWLVKVMNEEALFDTYKEAKKWMDNLNYEKNVPSNTTFLQFYDGLAIIQIQDKYGCLDSSGTKIIETKYDEITSFENGFARVRLENKWGMVNKKGKIIIPIQYEQLGTMADHRISFKENKLFGFLNAEGKMVIKPQFERVANFNMHYAAVSKQGLWGYIDTNGKVMIDYLYTTAKPFQDSVAAVQKDYRKFGFINLKNQTVIDFQYDDAESFSEGFAFVNMDRSWVEINLKGEVLKLSKGDSKTSVVPIRIGGKWGFKDKENRLVIPPQYDMVKAFWGDFMEIIQFSENSVSQKQYGIVNTRTGQVLLRPEYEDVRVLYK